MTTRSAAQRVTTHAHYKPEWLPYDVDDHETLAEATAKDRHIRAICICGQVAEFDASAWVERGLWFKPLTEFSGSRRCPCGSRRAEVWPGPLGQSALPMWSAASLYD